MPEAFYVKERDPTMFRIYADLFDDKALTSIKACLTHSNVLCLLKHGLALLRRLKLIDFTLAIGQKELDQGKGRACCFLSTDGIELAEAEKDVGKIKVQRITGRRAATG